MKTKRSTRLIAALGAIALVAAACGDGGGSGDFEAGELGAVSVEAGEAIQIRSLQVLSGPDSSLGIPEDNAVRLAVADYGDIAGHAVDVGTGLDELCTADGGQTAAQTIAADDQVVGVVGTSCSGAATAAMPLINDANMVMISGSNTSPALTSDFEGTAGSDYHEGYYRTAHNDLIQGQAAAEFVYNELGLTTAALIHDGDPYTNGLTTAFETAFTELGGTISVHTAFARGSTDAVPVLTEVAASEPELVFMPIFVEGGTFIVQQKAGISGLEDAVFMGADGLMSTTDFLPLPESEGMYFSGPDLRFGDNANEATDVSADDFLAAYEAEHGEGPTAPFWAHAYDATTLLLTAIEEVAVQDGDTLHIDRLALREALTAISGFEGITGNLSCDEFGDCAAGRVTVVHHESAADPEATAQNVVYEYAP